MNQVTKDCAALNNSDALSAVDRLQVVRIKAVMDLTGKPKSTIFAECAKGTFPAPIRLGEDTVGWYLCEIREWLASRPRVVYQPPKSRAKPAVAAEPVEKRGRGRPRKAAASSAA